MLDLFEKAKLKASCIVFIDEIDEVGRQRGGDGRREGRPDVLGSALLRLGRFDR